MISLSRILSKSFGGKKFWPNWRSFQSYKSYCRMFQSDPAHCVMSSVHRILAQAACAISLFIFIDASFAKPLVRLGSSLQPTLVQNDISEPTCTETEHIGASNASSVHMLGAFPRECIDTANQFFTFPLVAQMAWHWKRQAPGEVPQPGYNFLPLSAAPTGKCESAYPLLDPRRYWKFSTMLTLKCV